MVAYHFPPLAGSSGIQRTLRFVQHLPALGWEPIVLTAQPRAYEQTRADLLADVPAQTRVVRAFALDTTRHLTIKGRYMAWMARPDRWVTWRFDAVRQGLALIRAHRPDAIWSTYPIATAHLIGAELHRRSGLPWVADFRDPMAQEGYPADPVTWAQFQRIEAGALERATRSIFTTPGAAAMYAERYPQWADRIEVIENGYDEESFSEAPTSDSSTLPDQPLVLLHSGIVYPSERDPTQLFQALGRLLHAGAIGPAGLRLRFRASAHDDFLRRLASQCGVESLIELSPPVGYRDALREMLQVDALLVMQASNCNAQIPAKVYEYLRAGRPIAALTDPVGDTAGVLRDAGVNELVQLDDADAIAQWLPAFLLRLRQKAVDLPRADKVAAASRLARSRALAELLDREVPRRGGDR